MIKLARNGNSRMAKARKAKSRYEKMELAREELTLTRGYSAWILKRTDSPCSSKFFPLMDMSKRSREIQEADKRDVTNNVPSISTISVRHTSPYHKQAKHPKPHSLPPFSTPKLRCSLLLDQDRFRIIFTYMYDTSSSDI